MNERIKLLAEKAGVKMNAYGRPIPASLASNFDELAELIVKECMSLVSEPGPDMNDTERGILAQIKEHFGVEE